MVQSVNDCFIVCPPEVIDPISLLETRLRCLFKNFFLCNGFYKWCSYFIYPLLGCFLVPGVLC